MTDYERGCIAAQLGEPFDRTKSIGWQQGYIAEIYYPSGGLTPQEGDYNKIDFSRYIFAFKSFCQEHGITFETQTQADQYYFIWNAGFQWAQEYYH